MAEILAPDNEEMLNLPFQVPEEPTFQALYDLDESEKEDILREQNERLRYSARYMAPLFDDMIKKYKKYRSIAEPLKDELGREVAGRANIYVPYPWAIVESAMPRLAGRLPRVHAFPRQEIEEKRVEAIQDLIIYALDRMQFLRLQQQWIRQFEIYGWSPLVFFWRNEQKDCFERVRDDFDGSYKMRKVKKTVWDDFGARVLDVFDSFLQPGVENIEDGDWFMFREWKSKKDIKGMVDGGVFYPEVMKYIEDNPSSSGHFSLENDVRNDRDQMTGLVKDFQKHSYGRYEVVYTLENNRIIVMIDGKILARVGDNPHPLQEKPIINLNLLPMVNEPIGVSTIEALGGLPDKLNALTNARLDNISLLINKVILADRFSNTDFDNIVMSAGNVILTDDVDKSMKFLDIPDVSQSSEREVLSTKEELQFVSGVSDYLVGTKGSARLSDTATGVSSILREANARFSIKLATFEAYALRKLIESIHLYNMMYMSDEKRIYILGPKGYVTKNIKLDDILVEADFLVEPGSSAPLDQLSRREALVQLLDRVLQLPQVVNIGKFVREVFESYDIRNPDDYLLVGQAPLPQAQDAELAAAENIALSQGQDIQLLGDDRLHMQIHDAGLRKPDLSPEAKQAITAHIQAHYQHEQQIMMQYQQAGMNTMFGGGQNGPQANTQQNAPQPGAGAPAPQGNPGMGGGARPPEAGAGRPMGPGIQG